VKRFLIIFIPLFLLVGGLSLHARMNPDSMGEECAETGILMKRLMKEEKLAYAATMIEEKGKVMQLFFSPQTGKWVILHVQRGAKNACIMMRGVDFATLI
jgi:hypothetical protein